MNTRQMQLYKATNTVIEEFIKSGIFPRVGDVQAASLRALSGALIGAPTCKVRLVQYNSVTDPEQYNELFTTAVNDIQLLYDMITDQLRRLVVDMDYQMTLRSRTKTAIRQLEVDLGMIAASPPYIYNENLCNLNNIDLELTTARIHHDEATITLPEDIRFTRRVFPKIRSISQQGSSNISSPYNIFDDSLNTVWFSKYSTNTSKPYSITMSVSFEEPISFNKIVCHGFSPRIMSMAITLNTVDGTKSLDVKGCDTYSTASWYLPTYTVAGLTITMTKQKADYLSSSLNPYTYIFGLQSIELYNAQYINHGEVVSKAIKFCDIRNEPQGIINVKMNVTQMPAEDCETSQYLCITNDNVPTEWMRIMPGKMVILQEPDNYIRYLTTASYYEFNSDYAIPVYKLTGQITGVPKSAYNLVLYRNFMWKIQYYFYSVSEDNINQYTDSDPTQDDFLSTRGDTEDIYITWHTFKTKMDENGELYIDGQSEGIGADSKKLPSVAGNKKRMVMFTTYITWKTNEVIQLKPLSTWWGNSSKVNIYLNDSQATFTSSLEETETGVHITGIIYSLNMIKGVNKLCIVTNDYFAWDFLLFNAILSSININNDNSNCDIYPLTQVSMYDLIYNTRQGDVSRFAIDHDGNVLVTNSQNISYKLSYDNLRTNSYEYNLFYKIILNRESEDKKSTPVINNINIVVNDLVVK